MKVHYLQPPASWEELEDVLNLPLSERLPKGMANLEAAQQGIPKHKKRGTPIKKSLPPWIRFLLKIEPTLGCWLWKGDLNQDGYGMIGFCRRGIRVRFQAHRLSFMMHCGPIPDELNVLHHCDNPPCTRPDHLWLGTVTDNNRDAFSKGRNAVGSLHYCAKLTEPDILQIKDLYLRQNIGAPTIARIYRLNCGTVYRILHNKGWKHVIAEARNHQ